MNKVLALLLIFVIAPLWLLIAAVQFLVFKKVFFVQERTGKNLKTFKVYKLQTIKKNSSEIPGWGLFLRRTSLDETPQLINVVLGDMNFVGPRPLLPEYVGRYSEYQNKRHLVKPGITGWAQVNGRTNISWTEQFEYDVWYVNNRSFLVDAKVLGLTVRSIFSKNSNASKRPPFQGSG